MRTTASGSADGLLAMLAPVTGKGAGVATAAVACRPPLLQACSPVAPAYKESTAECFFFRDDDGCQAFEGKQWGPAAVGSVTGCGGLSTGDERAVCEAVPLDAAVQRLCACKEAAATSGGGRARRAAGADDQDEEENGTEAKGAAGDEAIAPATLAKRWLPSSPSSTASRASPASQAWGVAAITCWLASRPAAGASGLGVGGGAATLTTALGVGVAAALLLLPDVTLGHNWLLTPSRSFNKASTTLPCIIRKATDTHQQIGPNQTFTVKFATGQ